MARPLLWKQRCKLNPIDLTIKRISHRIRNAIYNAQPINAWFATTPVQLMRLGIPLVQL
jgi:hypothetical protein